MDNDEQEVGNIRDTLIAACIGRKLIDVTQHDKDEERERGAFVVLMFDNGATITFPVDDVKGFEVETPGR